MAAVNYNRLAQLYEAKGVQSATMEVQSLFEAKEFRPADFDLGRLWSESYGWHNFLAVRSGQAYASDVMQKALQEAQGAVTTAMFSNITGQIVYSALIEPYKSEEFVFTQSIPEIQTQFLDGEKFAGITEIGDQAAVRSEGYPYVQAGVGENWIFSPPPLDRGIEVPITWEAVFNDRTGQVLQRCNDVGHWGAVNREKRAADCVIDLNTTKHRYNWRGTTIASYGDNTGSHTWDNLAGTNALTDWVSLNAAEQVLNTIVDPFTGEPIDIMAKDLIVTKSLQHVAERILHATEIDVATPGYATSGAPTRTKATNPYLNKLQIKTNRWLAARIAAGSGLPTTWWYGDIAKYARYAVAEKLQVVPMPANSMEEYRRRIVAGWRVNERGAYFVWDPRYICQNTVA